MEKCSTLVMKQIQIISTTRNRTPISMVKIKRLIITSVSEDVKQLEYLYIVGGDVRMAHRLWRKVWQFLKK